MHLLKLPGILSMMEVSNQMLELYEQNRVPPSQGSEVEGSAGGGASHRAPSKAPSANEEHVSTNSYSQAGGITSKPGTSKPALSRPVSDQPYADNHGGPPRTIQNHSNEYGSAEMTSGSDHKADGESQDNQQPEPEPLRYQGNMGEAQNISRFGSEGLGEEDQERREAGELKDKHLGRNLEYREYREGTLGQSPQEAIKKIDKDKVKAALEKRRKIRGDISRKADLIDEDDLIERELEDGIELAAESDKIKRERRQSWSKHSNRPEDENSHYGKHQEDAGDGHRRHGSDLDYVEEGEVSVLDDPSNRGLRSPKSSNRKRKTSPPDKPLEGKQRHDYMHGSHHHNQHDYIEDRNRLGRVGYSERDHKRHPQENHV